MFDVPVLLILFNRPDTTQEVFNKIRRIQPRTLYVAADGPRPEIPRDRQSCEKVRRIVQDQIDWDCKVKYKLEKENLGCGKSVYSAISWAFRTETQLIILEDDTVPALPFFPYCEDLLAYYQEDPRIWVISGLNHFAGKKNLNDDSYFFSHYAPIGGWATWKRCWDRFDLGMKDWPVFQQSGFMFSHLPKKQGLERYRQLDRIYREKIMTKKKMDAWASQFSFAVWANSGVGIVPGENLISNIGIKGTHSTVKLFFHGMDVSETYKIKKRPRFFQTNHSYDQSYFDLFYPKENLFNKLTKRWLKANRAT